MVETHESRGLWELPSDETKKLSGALTVTKGVAALELIWHFGHELSPRPRGRRRPLLAELSAPNAGFAILRSLLHPAKVPSAHWETGPPISFVQNVRRQDS